MDSSGLDVSGVDIGSSQYVGLKEDLTTLTTMLASLKGIDSDAAQKQRDQLDAEIKTARIALTRHKSLLRLRNLLAASSEKK